MVGYTCSIGTCTVEVKNLRKFIFAKIFLHILAMRDQVVEFVLLFLEESKVQVLSRAHSNGKELGTSSVVW